MATLDVFNMKREKVGSIDLADEVFATEVKEQLFYEVVKAQLASRRAGTQSGKERAAVSGSTKKLYKQKGTGRAPRLDSCADYVGGGRAHRRALATGVTGPASGAGRAPGALSPSSIRRPPCRRRTFRARGGEDQRSSRGARRAAGGKEGARGRRGDERELKLSIRNCENHQFLPPEGVNLYDLSAMTRWFSRGKPPRRSSSVVLRKPGDSVGLEASAAAPAVKATVAGGQAWGQEGSCQEGDGEMKSESVIRRPIVLTRRRACFATRTRSSSRFCSRRTRSRFGTRCSPFSMSKLRRSIRS